MQTLTHRIKHAELMSTGYVNPAEVIFKYNDSWCPVILKIEQVDREAKIEFCPWHEFECGPEIRIFSPHQPLFPSP
jgi:hypothetical protein